MPIRSFAKSPRRLGVGEQLDAARLAASAHQDLGLHDDVPTESLGDGARLRRIGGDLARRDGDAVLRQQILGLVFVKLHGTEIGYQHQGPEGLSSLRPSFGVRPRRDQFVRPVKVTPILSIAVSEDRLRMRRVGSRLRTMIRIVEPFITDASFVPV